MPRCGFADGTKEEDMIESLPQAKSKLRGTASQEFPRLSFAYLANLSIRVFECRSGQEL
jgi:hypothetical protein